VMLRFSISCLFSIHLINPTPPASTRSLIINNLHGFYDLNNRVLGPAAGATDANIGGHPRSPDRATQTKDHTTRRCCSHPG
jgi:hypothetical protein